MQENNRLTTLAPWMTETLNNYCAQLSLSKRHPTVSAYTHDIGKFLEFLAEKKVRKLTTVKPEHVVGYLSYCKLRGKSDASVNRYYMSIRSYCKFLRKSKLVLFDLTEDITPPQNKQVMPYVPTIEEVQRILNQPNMETESGVRDKAILELLYSSGLRASELCGVKFQDLAHIEIKVSCGKGGKYRTVPLTEQASESIRLYIDKYRGKESGWLFQTLQCKKMRRELLCKIVGFYAKKAGVEDVTTHTLRHACATHLLNGGADIRMIQEVLGHSSIRSTQRYTQLSTNSIQVMFNQSHPRAKNGTIT